MTQPAIARATKILVSLKTLFNPDIVSLMGLLWRIASPLLTFTQPQGMYEVLEHEVCLELLDIKGKKAIYHKRQRVRFLQDNIIAYQDQAWGDGNLFASYHCSPGIAVDRYQEGHRYRVLISLRETKNRGDLAEFQIKRGIENGFITPTEYFQSHVEHATRKVSMAVIFPIKRFPKRATLVEHNKARTTLLNSEQCQTLPDGRQQIQWETEKPTMFETYSLRWEW